MTFSLAARCTRTGRFGVAAASSSPAVAARCIYAQAGIGAATTQNVTDPRLGPQALKLLALGADAAQASAIVKQAAPHAAYRQVTIIDAQGRTAGYSGDRTLGTYAMAMQPNAIAAGNLLANEDVPRAIVNAFLTGSDADELGDRIIAAMRAGLAAGGEAGSIHSVGMLIVNREAWPLTDLRVDWHDSPIDELSGIWRVWKPQAQDYVMRALNPDQAPSYGVAGDPGR